MALKLMYLTNSPRIAAIAEKNGVDRIFLDLELRGKEARQANMDTVISHNSFADVRPLRAALHKAELLVRINSVYDGTKDEVDRVIKDGADVVMLPYFKTAKEVESFINAVNGRAKTCLLCETPEAAEHIDEILSVPGIDEVHIGINDLHLGYHRHFMFELVADGTVERLCTAFRQRGLFYGFGGVGRPGGNVPLPAENIIDEHYRLQSNMVILSRAFCDVTKVSDEAQIEEIFRHAVADMRAYEAVAAEKSAAQLQESHLDTQARVQKIVEKIKAAKGE